MNAGLSFTRFSEINLLDFQVFETPADIGCADNEALLEGATDHHSPKAVTDLVFGFELSDHLKLQVDNNNLLNIYPDQKDDRTESGGYWDSVRMGFSGSYYYSRLSFIF